MKGLVREYGIDFLLRTLTGGYSDLGTVASGGSLLLGADLVKSPERLHAAYNDAAGVTAAFNKNLLARINRYTIKRLRAEIEPVRLPLCRPLATARGRISRLFLRCSRQWAIQPATRLTANVGSGVPARASSPSVSKSMPGTSARTTASSRAWTRARSLPSGTASGLIVACAGTASGTLSFLSGSVGSTNLWFERTNGAGALSATGANLRVSVLGTSQVAIVDSFFPTVGPLKPLSSFTAGGLTLDTGFANVLAAMRAYELAHTGFSAATASGTITDTTVLAAVNAAWH